jgi:hypothetical protein
MIAPLTRNQLPKESAHTTTQVGLLALVLKLNSRWKVDLCVALDAIGPACP